MDKIRILIASSHYLKQLAFAQLFKNLDEENFFLLVSKNKKELLENLTKGQDSIVLFDARDFDYLSSTQLKTWQLRFPASIWGIIPSEPVNTIIKDFVTEKEVSLLSYDMSKIEWEQALSALVKKQRYISRSFKEIIKENSLNKNKENSLTLSEKEILTLIGKGYTKKQIASSRHSSEYTIATHRKNIYRKLQINTAYEAMKSALRMGLIQESDFNI